MAPPQIAVAVVGEGASLWPGLEAVGDVEHLPVEPTLFRSVESGLNHALAQTAAPYYFVCGTQDQVDAAGLVRLAQALEAAPLSAVGAVGTVLEAGPNGQLRQLTPQSLFGRRALLALPRVPPLPLLRTAALRHIGGWRTAEAAWPTPLDHHRGVLARLLDGATLLAAPAAQVGLVDQQGPVGWPRRGPLPLSGPAEPTNPATSQTEAAPLPDSIGSVAQHLLYHLVCLRVRGLKAPLVGRIAALSAGLLTLAGDGAQITLVPLDRILSIGTTAQVVPPSTDARPTGVSTERLSPNQVPERSQPRTPEGSSLVRVRQGRPQNWPSDPS